HRRFSASVPGHSVRRWTWHSSWGGDSSPGRNISVRVVIVLTQRRRERRGAENNACGCNFRKWSASNLIARKPDHPGEVLCALCALCASASKEVYHSFLEPRSIRSDSAERGRVRDIAQFPGGNLLIAVDAASPKPSDRGRNHRV